MGSYRKQIKTVMLIELAIITVAGSIAYTFWQGMCDGSWSSCLAEGWGRPFSFFVLAAFRPLLFTPIMIVAFIGGDAFGHFWGTIFTAVGTTASGMIVYFFAKMLGRRYSKPWLSANLPATWKLIRTQDYKLVFATRLIPVFPFDLMSFVYGALSFRGSAVFFATLIGSIPEAYMFTRLSIETDATVLESTIRTLTEFSLATLFPLIIYEVIARKRGSSLWTRLKRVYRELVYEARATNNIVKSQTYSGDKTPVILLYGFFSSRRALTVLERLLTQQGHQVMSFNLGGLFGVFFTRGIEEAARFLDMKIGRQIKRHGFERFHIVSHSKGGLVALWWLLRLGGVRYCDTLITMGTPFTGSRLTYLALVTPLGFFWRDVWQMRPNSLFLKELHELEIPPELSVFCFHSEKDKVSTGINGVFRPLEAKGRIVPVPMHAVSHFEFLTRRDVGDYLAKILREADQHALGANRHDPEAPSHSVNS